jgi:hypothetical protein
VQLLIGIKATAFGCERVLGSLEIAVFAFVAEVVGHDGIPGKRNRLKAEES